jgi:glycosyltransferase involved in cell wall biosynthesis
LRSLTFIVPGSIDTPTGGYVYDRRMVEGLVARDWAVDVRQLDGSFPRPAPMALKGAARVLASIPDNEIVVIDGLALGAMPEQIGREAKRLRVVALVHMPLAYESGLSTTESARLEISEREALQSARLVVVTGRSTVGALTSWYKVPSGRVVVVEPGIDPVPLAKGSGHAAPHLISIGTFSPGKGHDILLRALARVRNPEWRLTCAGSLTRDPKTVARLRELIPELGLERKVSLVGTLDANGLEQLYQSADLFVLATLHESYGMAVAEALAHGLPVVSTATGAIPDLVGSGPGAAGVLAKPGDVDSFTDALDHVLGDRKGREALTARARAVRTRLRTWDNAFDRMSAALERVRTHG